jgi:hypothetical protein
MDSSTYLSARVTSFANDFSVKIPPRLKARLFRFRSDGTSSGEMGRASAGSVPHSVRLDICPTLQVHSMDSDLRAMPTSTESMPYQPTSPYYGRASQAPRIAKKKPAICGLSLNSVGLTSADG